MGSESLDDGLRWMAGTTEKGASEVATDVRCGVYNET